MAYIIHSTCGRYQSMMKNFVMACARACLRACVRARVRACVVTTRLVHCISSIAEFWNPKTQRPWPAAKANHCIPSKTEFRGLNLMEETHFFIQRIILGRTSTTWEVHFTETSIIRIREATMAISDWIFKIVYISNAIRKCRSRLHYPKGSITMAAEIYKKYLWLYGHKYSIRDQLAFRCLKLRGI